MEVVWKYHGNNMEVGIIAEKNVEIARKLEISWKWHGKNMELM